MYITKCGCVFLKLGERIYVAMDLIPILLGSLPLAHNAQHSLVFSTSTMVHGTHTHIHVLTYTCMVHLGYGLSVAA